jgi:hypothetical protein
LELLPAQDGVIAMRATGLLDLTDIERGIAAVDEALSTHARLAIFAEVDMTGMTARALLKDISYGLSMLGKLRRFWRAAVVTDQHWVRWIARAENALFPVEIRVFPLAAKEEAMAWVSERAP